MPDETRSNVYKLFRATRVSPDTKIRPDEQLAFYDAGLGSRGEVGEPSRGFWRRIYNFLSQGTGLGITRNVIDCYAAIIRMWEPGDRIYLFGFSRGAYTVRCVGGVLFYCGVPTHMKDGSPLKRDSKSAHAIAAEAVKDVYQYGSSIKGDPLRGQRMERAYKFRNEYGSGNTVRSNESPYFIGVWDTVSTLGAGWRGIFGIAIAYLALAFVIASLIKWGVGYFASGSLFDFSRFTLFVTFAFVVPGLLYVIASVRYKQPLSLKRYRMAFYNTNLDPAVSYARHALSIDENRRDFPRVPWSEEAPDNPLLNKKEGVERFVQIWFAGNHSDIGGSYAENESRLSDIALSWMVEQATSVSHPIVVDRSLLNLYPLSSGPQHDERRSLIDRQPGWLIKLASRFIPPSKLGWAEGFRQVPPDAPLHPSVLERFTQKGVLIYGDTVPYRPNNLRQHRDTKHFYS